MTHDSPTQLKTVGSSGQLTLGKRFSGRHFEVEELPGGELLLRPVRLVRESAAQPVARTVRRPAFAIAEVERVVMPSREQRNARRG